MPKKLKFLFCAVMLALSQAYAQQGIGQPLSRQVYLKCVQTDEPEGASDLHIDFANRVITDSFATARQFKEEGPFLIAETFTELNGRVVVTSTIRVNRFTLAYEFISPQLNVYKRVQCAAIEGKI
jgi:hypothetical protein